MTEIRLNIEYEQRIHGIHELRSPATVNALAGTDGVCVIKACLVSFSNYTTT